MKNEVWSKLGGAFLGWVKDSIMALYVRSNKQDREIKTKGRKSYRASQGTNHSKREDARKPGEGVRGVPVRQRDVVLVTRYPREIDDNNNIREEAKYTKIGY